MDKERRQLLHAVIMAGGTGTRLWPRSRQNSPKQLLDLVHPGTTLLQETFARLRPLIPTERIFVIASSQYRDAILGQLAEMPPENFIQEPSGRGTAPAIGLATIHLAQRREDAIILATPADHIIMDEERFRHALLAASAHAENGYLVTLGIQPTRPDTGFGYIERNELLPRAGGVAYGVARFVEKPDPITAERFYASGNYYWNGGTFISRVRDMRREIEKRLPDLARGLAEIENAIGQDDYISVLNRVWPTLPNITIDYGVMEEADHVAVVPLDAGWSDIGTWAALSECLPSDAAGNVIVQGEHVGLDTADTVVYASDPNRLIATIGLHGFVLVDTEDALLVCPKSRAQDVRQMVALLKRRE